MQIVIICIIALALIIALSNINKVKKFNSQLTKKNEELNSSKELEQQDLIALKNELEKAKEKLRKTTDDLAELQQEIDNDGSGAWGEISFHKQMTYLLKNRNIFRYYYFFSDVVFPAESNRFGRKKTYNSQVDHILICEYGIFLFNTKKWNGDVYIESNSSPTVAAFRKGNRKNSNYTIHNDKLRFTNHIDKIQQQSKNFYNFLNKVSYTTPVLTFCLNENSSISIINKNGETEPLPKLLRIMNGEGRYNSIYAYSFKFEELTSEINESSIALHENWISMIKEKNDILAKSQIESIANIIKTLSVTQQVTNMDKITFNVS